MMTPERKERLTTVLNNRQPDLTVILENVVDPHNIFAVMRTCDAVGIQDVYIIKTDFKPHRKFGKNSSSTAAKWVDTHHFDNIDSCLSTVRKKYNRVLCAYLSDDATPLYDLDMTESIALVFGNERAGVSDELMSKCDGNFIIPQMGMIRSLNISVACAVSLYEGLRQRQIKGYYNGSARLDSTAYELLEAKWSQKDKASTE